MLENIFWNAVRDARLVGKVSEGYGGDARLSGRAAGLERGAENGSIFGSFQKPKMGRITGQPRKGMT